jgi:hypothetical protein
MTVKENATEIKVLTTRITALETVVKKFIVLFTPIEGREGGGEYLRQYERDFKEILQLITWK